MKKVSLLICLLAVLVALTACSAKERQADDITAVSEITTTTQRVTNTTAPVSIKKEESKKLCNTVSKALGSENATVTADKENGSFVYKISNADYSKIYANEASDEHKETAEKNAAKLIDEIKAFYPDEITLESSVIQTLGSGENGVDSAIYVITYVNTQNQELVIRADSNGEIYYVNCTFTW